MNTVDSGYSSDGEDGGSRSISGAHVNYGGRREPTIGSGTQITERDDDPPRQPVVSVHASRSSEFRKI